MKMTNNQTRQSEAIFLDMAIDTIRLNAITNTVKAVRESLEKADLRVAHTSYKATAVIRNLHPYRIAMRVAAALVLILGSATICKYSAVNTQSIYNQQYTGYELQNSRGVSPADIQAEAYRNKNWNEVILLNNNAVSQTNKSRFLAAVSDMELEQYTQAQTLFQAILANQADESFHDEADYYSALAWLASHNKQKGLDMISKIKANRNHIYFPLVDRISSIDLTIIGLKK